jgi:hypothetical protein
MIISYYLWTLLRIVGRRQIYMMKCSPFDHTPAHPTTDVLWQWTQVIVVLKLLKIYVRTSVLRLWCQTWDIRWISYRWASTSMSLACLPFRSIRLHPWLLEEAPTDMTLACLPSRSIRLHPWLLEWFVLLDLLIYV